MPDIDATPWIVVDTETSGLQPPIRVVEFAAQRMRGWEPEGPPFRRLIDHGIDIAPAASRINGLTREILERDGEPPQEVHRAFFTYAGDLPLAAYNLAYDHDDVLVPEWSRLGLAPRVKRGFCVLRLSQRLLDPLPAGNCKLQTLRRYFGLPERPAHTALGDVETTIDLLRQVLRPLAQERGLVSLDHLRAFTEEAWFPTRLPFGCYKGRDIRDAARDPGFREWLEWLAAASSPRSAEMGRWYLDRLARADDERSAMVGAETSVVIYGHREAELLRGMIKAARVRLAELEAELAKERRAVAAVQAQLFGLLGPLFKRRDELRLLLEFRRRYLEELLQRGEEQAEETEQAYEEARRANEQEYAEADRISRRNRNALSEVEQDELKALWRKLVRVFHTDHLQGDPEKHEAYARLMTEINRARDDGDLERLREIARDPDGVLARLGVETEAAEAIASIEQLRRLHEHIQVRILEVIDALDGIRAGADYELHRRSLRDADWFDMMAPALSRDLEGEIARLDDEVARLTQEIERLQGRCS